MFWAFFSMKANLHWKIFVFQYMHLCCIGTKYLVLLQLLFLYPSAILGSNYAFISWNVDCTASFLGCYEVEKRIDNSGKFLELDGNMLMHIGSAEITVVSHQLFWHKMSELYFLHAIKMSELINLSVIHLSKLCLKVNNKRN